MTMYHMLMNDLRDAMTRDGRTVYRLAKLSGLTHATLYRFTSSGTGLNIESAEALADVLGFDVRLVKRDAAQGKPRTR
jgi:transcriptional regulator with XRE-family HTH domain